MTVIDFVNQEFVYAYNFKCSLMISYTIGFQVQHKRICLSKLNVQLMQSQAIRRYTMYSVQLCGAAILDQKGFLLAT